MRYKVMTLRDLSPSTYVLRLERNGFQFQPGQCVNLGTTGSGVNREYSTYSGIDDPYLEFLIKEVRGGTVSTALRKVSVGDEVDMHGAYGSFVIDPDRVKSQSYVFIATGTGIAPFHSFVKSYPELEYRLIAGVRKLEERFDLQDYDPERVSLCVSREQGDHFSGRVTDYLKRNPINKEKIYYLCGNQSMIHEVYNVLREAQVSGDHIFTEAFF